MQASSLQMASKKAEEPGTAGKGPGGPQLQRTAASGLAGGQPRVQALSATARKSAAAVVPAKNSSAKK